MSNVVDDCLRKIADVQVCGVVDPDETQCRTRLSPDEQKSVIFCKDLHQLVAKTKPDALLIGTRCNLHTPYAIEAAQYDLPLYLEKPVAISMDQALGLERAFENSRCQAVVSFPLRLSPLCQLAKQIIDRGAIGSCEHVAAKNFVNYGTVYWEEEYRNYAITQGLFLQKGTHDFDYISYLMGSPIVRIAAMGNFGRVFGGRRKPAGLRCSQCPEADTCLESPINRKRNSSSELLKDHPCIFGADCGSPETGTNEDASSALIEFASGVHGVYTQVFFTRREAHSRGLTISGYNGTLSFDWYENELKLVRHHEPFTDISRVGGDLNHFGGDLELAHDFIGLIKGTGFSRSTIWDGLRSVYTCLAAKESMQKGTFVSVRQAAAPDSSAKASLPCPPRRIPAIPSAAVPKACHRSRS